MSINVVKMEYIVPDENDDPIAGNLLGVSEPTPTVVLEEVSASDVQLRDGIATVTIRGHVLDPLADNAPGVPVGQDGAEIEHVYVYLDEEYTGVSAAVTRNQAYAQDPANKSFWRQYPYRGDFPELTISFPVSETVLSEITVRTSQNGVGNTGEASVRIEFGRRTMPGLAVPLDGATGVAIDHTVVLAAPLEDAATLEYTRGIGLASETAILTKALGEGHVFEGQLAGYPVQLRVLQITGSPAVLTGLISYGLPAHSDYGSMLSLEENPPASGTFVGTSTVHFPMPLASGDPISVAAVEAAYTVPVESDQSYAPISFRVKAADPPPDLEIDIGGLARPLALKEDGYYYPVGSSMMVLVVIKREGKYYIVAYDENGKRSMLQAVGIGEPDDMREGFMRVRAQIAKLGGVYREAAVLPHKEIDAPLKLVQTVPVDVFMGTVHLDAGKARIHDYLRLQGEEYPKPHTFAEDRAALERVRQRREAGTLPPWAAGMGPEFYFSVLERIEQLDYNGIPGTAVYSALGTKLADSAELFEFVWYVVHQEAVDSVATWTGVPVAVLLSGIYTEVEDDPWHYVAAEQGFWRSAAGLFGQEAKGIGIANLHNMLPKEDVTGIPVSSALDRPGSPNPALAAEWESYASDPDSYRTTVQLDVNNSLIVYAAMWRSIAARLQEQAPARYTLPASVTGWTSKTVSDRSPDNTYEISMANVVMMVIEQTYVGFTDQDTGELVPVPPGRVDVRTGSLKSVNDTGDKRQNWGWLNVPWDDPTAFPRAYEFVTAAYDRTFDRVQAYVDLLQRLRQ